MIRELDDFTGANLRIRSGEIVLFYEHFTRHLVGSRLSRDACRGYFGESFSSIQKHKTGRPQCFYFLINLVLTIDSIIYSTIASGIPTNCSVASRITHSARKLQRISFPFQPKVLNFKEKSGISEIRSTDMITVTEIRNQLFVINCITARSNPAGASLLR